MLFFLRGGSITTKTSFDGSWAPQGSSSEPAVALPLSFNIPPKVEFIKSPSSLETQRIIPIILRTLFLFGRSFFLPTSTPKSMGTTQRTDLPGG